MECEYPPLLMRTAGSQLSVLGAGSLRPIIFYRRLSGSVFFFLLFQEVHEGYFYLTCPVLFLFEKGFL